MRSPWNITDWRLYLVLDRAFVGTRSCLDIARAALAGGVNVIQYRDKTSPDAVFRAEASAVLQLCRDRGIPFIVNDRVRIAAALGADGIHVGQDDMPARAVRRIIAGPDCVVGVSAASLEQARRAEADAADYIGAGPVFEARTSKPDALPPIGLAGLSAICRSARIPVIAIGGIQAGNAGKVIRTGAAGVAVISAIVGAADAESAARQLRAAIPSPNRKTPAARKIEH